MEQEFRMQQRLKNTARWAKSRILQLRWAKVAHRVIEAFYGSELLHVCMILAFVCDMKWYKYLTAPLVTFSWGYIYNLKYLNYFYHCMAKNVLYKEQVVYNLSTISNCVRNSLRNSTTNSSDPEPLGFRGMQVYGSINHAFTALCFSGFRLWATTSFGWQVQFHPHLRLRKRKLWLLLPNVMQLNTSLQNW